MRLKFTLLALCLFLSSCSVKLSYQFLDEALGWQLGRYVDLNSQQNKQAKAFIDEFHSWHRQTQLPLYADYLEQLKHGLNDQQVTAAYLHKESDVMQDMLDASMLRLLPGLTDVAMGLSDEQVNEVVEKLTKERKEYKEDYVDDSPEDISKRRLRDLKRYFEPFFGRFSKEQKQLFADWEAELEPYESYMLVQQLNWQKAFLQAMSLRSDRDALQASLKQLMLYRTDNWDAELQRRLDYNQEMTFEMLAKLFNSRSEKQRQRLARKFDQYAKDLRELAADK
ncbi:DUF6279 family lipoprotein [Agaribacterium haliotis]|uniref:DUF6279 family lipoprotein n=1 Tax=Agaribacterium haliotis TaxID=2013869 RepID=UPI000BB53FF3|nr:DUF6279 family lipoprotein [Agaribacterium haliotis]